VQRSGDQPADVEEGQAAPYCSSVSADSLMT
jgi:hypothetical protein